MSKIKCAHCQQVHYERFNCEEIRKLRTFVGDDQYQDKMRKKRERKRIMDEQKKSR